MANLSVIFISILLSVTFQLCKSDEDSGKSWSDSAKMAMESGSKLMANFADRVEDRFIDPAKEAAERLSEKAKEAAEKLAEQAKDVFKSGYDKGQGWYGEMSGGLGKMFEENQKGAQEGMKNVKDYAEKSMGKMADIMPNAETIKKAGDYAESAGEGMSKYVKSMLKFND